MTASIDTTPATRQALDAGHWSDMEICEALYWLRRARRRDDPAMMRIWTERMDSLLDWRLEHGAADVLPA
ncbi:hypothetical protein [uncultured Jatrophihabitans sp.]|uniref:hypothetical protein n=1 Tax=uncultured Jatrophihabitans sp. TaxID=1610747 RepID=UPI0035CAC6AD